MKNITLTLSLLIFVYAPTAWSAPELPVQGEVQFEAIGQPSALKIRGDSRALTGKAAVVDGKASGEFTLPLDTFATGLTLRDQHMKNRYLETGNFPKALFRLDPLTLPAGLNAEKGSAATAFSGELTLHGVTHKVNGQAQVSKASTGWTGEIEFGINLEDYAISVPSFAGVTVAKTVNVRVLVSAAEAR